MYSLLEIHTLRIQCEKYRLEGREILAAYTDRELQRICNGIGAEWMPDAARVFVSNLNPALEPVAMIHDVRWYLSTGKRADFEASNREFEANGLIMARARYGWYNPLRYRVMRRTKEFALILSLCYEGYRKCQTSSKLNVQSSKPEKFSPSSFPNSKFPNSPIQNSPEARP